MHPPISPGSQMQNGKTYMFLQKHSSYSGNLNPEVPGTGKTHFPHWGDVLGNVRGGFSCSAMHNVS